MTTCAYCERTLICEACGADYLPPSAEAYQALSRPDAAVNCPGCGSLLVCHWCKTPYDGLADNDEGMGGTDAPSPAG
jgi:hypothetical protein